MKGQELNRDFIFKELYNVMKAELIRAGQRIDGFEADTYTEWG